MRLRSPVVALLLYACCVCPSRAALRLNGLMKGESGDLFSLSTDGSYSQWLPLGARYNGYELLEYREDISVLKLRNESVTLFLKFGTTPKAATREETDRKEDISHLRVISIERNGYRIWRKNAAGQRFHLTFDILRVALGAEPGKPSVELHFSFEDIQFLQIKEGDLLPMKLPPAFIKDRNGGILPLDPFIRYEDLRIKSEGSPQP